VVSTATTTNNYRPYLDNIAVLTGKMYKNYCIMFCSKPMNKVAILF